MLNCALVTVLLALAVTQADRKLQKPDKPTDPLRVEEGKPGATTPRYRVTASDEKRLEGLLYRIDCPRGGTVTVRVRSENVPVAMTAQTLRDIDFISYREDRPGSVACGVFNPAVRVYVTWRPLTPAPKGIAGRAIAVEFLPDK